MPRSQTHFLAKFIAILLCLSLALSGGAGNASAMLTDNKMGFSDGNFSVFAEQALMAPAVEGFLGPEDTIAARNAKWASEALRSARDALERALEHSSPLQPFTAQDHSRLQSALISTAHAADDELLAPYVSDIVAASPQLQDAKSRLGSFKEHRDRAALALEIGDALAAREHLTAMRRELVTMRWRLRRLPGDRNQSFHTLDLEMEQVSHGMAILTGHVLSGSPPAFLRMAVEHIVTALRASMNDASDASVLRLVGITSRTMSEAWWPELLEFLRYRLLVHGTDQRGFSSELQRYARLTWLLQRVDEEKLSAVAAAHFWEMDSDIGRQDWAEYFESIQPRADPTAADQPPAVAVKLEQWLKRYGRVAAVATIVLSLTAGIASIWKNRSPAENAPSSAAFTLGETSTAKSPEPFVSSFTSGSLSRRNENSRSAKQSVLRERQEAHRTIQRQMNRVERQRQLARQQVRTEEKKFEQAKQGVSQAQKKLEQTQTQATDKAVSQRKKAFDQSRDNFQKKSRSTQSGKRDSSNPPPKFTDRLTGLLRPGAKEMPAWLVRMLPRSYGEEAGSNRLRDAASAGMENLGDKQTIIQFEKPIVGLVNNGVWEEFDQAKGIWVRNPIDPKTLASVPDPQNAVTTNRAATTLHDRFVLLAIPRGYAPIARSFRFSKTGVKYDLREDRFGHFYLWITEGPVPVEATFELREEPVSAAHDLPQSTLTVTPMEDLPWQSDTARANNSAKAASTFDEKVAILHAHIQSTFEYTISNEFSKKLYDPPGHVIGNYDRLHVAISGMEWRIGDCQANAYFIATARAIGLHARMRSVWAIRNPATEVTTWDAHAVSEVFNPEIGQWVEIDATPLDRFPNGDETKYREELPIQQTNSPEVTQAHKQLEDAQQAARRAQEPLTQAREAVDQADSERRRLEARLQELEKPLSEQGEMEVTIDAEQAEQLAHDASEMTASAQRDPEALANYLSSPTMYPEVLRNMMNSPDPDPAEIRYEAAYLELGMNALAKSKHPELSRKVLPIYLEWLRFWFSTDNTKRPMKIVTFWGNLGAQPASPDEVQKSEAPLLNLTHWSVMNSYPFPVKSAEPGSSGTISTLAADTHDSVNWVQTGDGAVLGFRTKHQLMSLAGKAALFPERETAPELHHVASSNGIVTFYSYGTTSIIRDALTDELIAPWLSTEHEVRDVKFDSEGNGFALTMVRDQQGRDKEWRLYEIQEKRHIPNPARERTPVQTIPASPRSLIHLVLMKGHVVLYSESLDLFISNQGDYYSIPMFDGTDGTMSALSFPSLYFEAGENNRVTIVTDPLTGDAYALYNSTHRHALFKIGDQGPFTSIVSNDEEEMDPPIFGMFEGTRVMYVGRSDKTAKQYIVDLFTPGKSSLVSQISTVMTGGAYRLIGADESGKLYLQVTNGEASHFTLLQREQRKESSFSLTSQIGPPDLALQGEPLFYKGKIYAIDSNGGSRLLEISNEGSRTLSSGNSLSAPIVWNDRIIFTEYINGVWQWRSVDKPLVDNVQIIGTTRGIAVDYSGTRSGALPSIKMETRAIVLVTLGSEEIHRLFRWNGKTLTALSSEDVYQAWVINGRVFYTTIATGGFTLFEVGREKPYFENESFIGSPIADKNGKVWVLTESTSSDWISVRRLDLTDPVEKLPNPFSKQSTDPRNPDGEIRTPQASPDGTIYVLTRFEGILRIWSSTGHSVEVNRVERFDSPVFSSNGAGYVRAKIYGTWRHVSLSDGAIVSDPQATFVGPITFTPGGEGYYVADYRPRQGSALADLLSGQRLLSLSDRKPWSFLGIDPIHSIMSTRDGRVFFSGKISGSFRIFELPGLTRTGGVVPQHALPQVTDHSSTSVFWGAQTQDVPRELYVDAGGGIVHENRVTRGWVNDQLGAVGSEAPIQGGPWKQSSVLYVPGANGEFTVVLDPDQEVDNKLAWAVTALESDPSIAQRSDWNAFRKALAARIEETRGPFMTAERRILLFYLFGGTPEQAKYARAIADLAKLPAHHAEARRALATVVRAVFEREHQLHSGAHLNPTGVSDASWVDRMLNNLILEFTNRPSPWRLGASPEDAETLAFDRDLKRLTDQYPWLQFERQDIPTSWTSTRLLFARVTEEMFREPIWWLLWAEFLSAWAGIYVEFKRLNARQHFHRQLRHWARQMPRDVFDFPDYDPEFTLEGLLPDLPRAERKTFRPYARFLKNEPPDVQAAAFLLLKRDGMIPPERSMTQRVLEPLGTVLTMPRQVYHSRVLEKAWELITLDGPDKGREVIGDRISYSAFMTTLEKKQALPIRRLLRRHKLLRQAV